MKKEDFSKKWDKTMFPVAEWCNDNGPKIIILLVVVALIGTVLESVLKLFIPSHVHGIFWTLAIIRLVSSVGAILFYLFSTWLRWLFKL